MGRATGEVPPYWWQQETQLAFAAKVVEAMLIDLGVPTDDWRYRAVRAVWEVAQENQLTIDAFVVEQDFAMTNPGESVIVLIECAKLYLQRGYVNHEVRRSVSLARLIIGRDAVEQIATQFTIEELSRRAYSATIEQREAAYAAWVIGERETALELLELQLEDAFRETVLDA